MSELLALKRTKDVEAIKSFVTNRSDNFRAPYARRTTKRPRQCVFAGTTNNKQFLSDPTGNRRFMPVEVHKDRRTRMIDDPDAPEHFAQAWAEALYKFKTEHPKIYFDDEMQKKMMAHQEEFTEEDPRIGMIQHYLDDLSITEKKRVCAVDIWRDALMCDVNKLTLKDTKEIHTLMREKIIGWHSSGKQRCDWGVQRCYERDGWIPVTDEEAQPF